MDSTASRSQSENAVLAPGDTLGDTYVVERSLGDGAIGQVYLARDTKLDRPVAVKLLHEARADSSEHSGRFRREALAMSRVVHPNVVGIHALGQHGARWYIAMEYVEGEDLEAYLEREGALEPSEALSIVRQVASGLSEAHALGIVHRDIKPSNILLRQLASGALLAKVVDFGLARTFEDGPLADSHVTMANAVVGTPQYMAPEQIQGEAALDGRADAYALAAMFFTMVTGRPPFEGTSSIGVMMAHLNQPPPTLAEAAPARVWPLELENAVQQALAKSPEDRFPSLEALVGALGGPLTSERAAVGGERSCGLCGAHARSDDKFCGHCGGVLPAVTCPTCNAPQPEDHPGFTCVSCGASLLASSQIGSTADHEQLGVALVARCLATEVPPDFAQTFTALVERERGRAVAVVGREAVGLFGLGSLFGRETESAMDVALSLARVSELEMVVGVEFGPLVHRGAGVAWHGAVVVDGPTVDGARAAADSLGDEPGIAIAERAYRKVRGVYETERTNDHHRRVKSRKNVPFGLGSQVVRGIEVPLVGRELELAMMMRAAKKVIQSGALSAVPIVGGPGLGKSRLVAEMLRQLEDDDRTVWRLEAGWCRPASLDTYGPLSQMLHARLQIHNAPAEGLVRERIAALPGVGGELPAPVVEARVEALGRLIGLGQSGSDVHNVRPASDDERRAAFDVFTEYLRAAAEVEPVVMLVGDLQWARRPTLELLAAVIQECQNVPLLLLLPVRAGAADDILESLLLPPSRTVALNLEPLDRLETRELASALVGGARLSDELTELIHGFSHGVPLQVEQAVETLIDTGVLTPGAEGWEVAPEVAADASLERPRDELMRQRLARLGPSQRAILEAVAVCGHAAPRSLLAAMIDRPLAAADLSALETSGLLVQVRQGRFPGEREFAFRQSSVADSALSTLQDDRRQTLQERAADWFMSYDGSRMPGFTALMGQHLLAAGDPARAARVMLDVASEATVAFANADAFEAYGTALELSANWRDAHPDDAEATVALLQAALGQATLGLRVGVYEPALEAARIASALSSMGDDRQLEHIQALCLEGDLLEATGENVDAIAAFAEAAEAATPLDAALGLAAYAGGRRAMVLLKSKMPDEAEEAARKVLAMGGGRRGGSRSTDLHRGLGSAHGALGHVMSARKAYDQARDHYATARMHRVAANDITGAAMASLSIGNVHYRSGDLEGARNAYEAALEACEEIGFARGIGVARTNLGNVLLDLDQPSAALVHLRSAEEWFRQRGEPAELAETLRLIEQAEAATA